MARPKKNTTAPKPAKIEDARAALAKEQKRKTKPDPFIDKAVTWLEKESTNAGIVVSVDVRILLQKAYAMARVDAAAVIGFLKQAKMDGRLLIEQVGDVQMVKIADDQQAFDLNDEPETLAPSDVINEKQDEPASDTAEKVETKSLAEHVKDAEGRQTRLPFPHGIGTWVKHTPSGVSAQILNMTTTGNITIYDLKSEQGGKLKNCPAFEIEQLAAQEESRIHDAASLSKLMKHNEDGQRLAQMLAAEQAEEVEQAGELKATRKRIDKLRDQIDAHLCGVPLDNQMKIDMQGEEATGTMSSPSAPTTAQERLLGRIAGKDVLELTGDNQPWAQLSGATLKAEASNGKPQKIIPLTIEQAPGNWVCVDCQDGVAVLLRAYPKAEWSGLYAAKYGEPRDLPNQDQTTVQAAGGPFTGCPVKVVRATLYLSPLDDALLLRLPAATAQA